MMSNIRHTARVLVSLVVLALGGSPGHAGERCQPDPYGQVVCEVGIPSERLEPITSQQAMSQWCWAASISMIFGYHGHALPQERIVQSVFGQLVDLPAMNGMVMSRSLARPWVDQRGRRFQAKVRVFDMHAGQFELDTESIITELREERPMLVGTVGHAMVMTALRYVRTPTGPQVIGVTVRDPWPGRGRRDLQWHEMQPQYLAAVDLGAKKRVDTPQRERVEPPDTADLACARGCALASERCVATLPSAELCLAQAVEGCVASCVYEYGNPPAMCSQRFCHPQANPQWAAQCQALAFDAQARCRAEDAACSARCL
ncbi:MAG TPA: papain-like cysteine protease family protein [Myxococcota bacterium]|nr:papain-like cysteine protease family protein [Myxococcota bacterium]